MAEKTNQTAKSTLAEPTATPFILEVGASLIEPKIEDEQPKQVDSIVEPEAEFDLEGYATHAGLSLWEQAYLKEKLGSYIRPLSVWAAQGVK